MKTGFWLALNQTNTNGLFTVFIYDLVNAEPKPKSTEKKREKNHETHAALHTPALKFYSSYVNFSLRSKSIYPSMFIV